MVFKVKNSFYKVGLSKTHLTADLALRNWKTLSLFGSDSTQQCKMSLKYIRSTGRKKKLALFCINWT